MKIAVTGATGFIGRHVVAELEARSISAVIVDRSPAPTGREPHQVVRMDVHSPPDDPFHELSSPDCLIHLAWQGLPNYASAHHTETELPAHYEFLRRLISAGLPNLVVAGTCLEYGLQPGMLSEDMPGTPVNPYGLAKSTLRKQLERLREVESFNLVWARLFYLFGEGQAPSSLFSQLTDAVRRGAETFDMSGGQQLRDYLPVTVAARHLVDLALLNEHVGVVNVCSGEPVRVERLVEGWVRENGWSIKLNLGRYPYPEYEPMEFWGDTSRLHSLVGSP